MNNAYVLLGGGMQDLHLSYVQASRAVESTRFYTDYFETGNDLFGIARKMTRSREKKMTSDLSQLTHTDHLYYCHTPNTSREATL